jgi:hypothetical protein
MKEVNDSRQDPQTLPARSTLSPAISSHFLGYVTRQTRQHKNYSVYILASFNFVLSFLVCLLFYCSSSRNVATRVSRLHGVTLHFPVPLITPHIIFLYKGLATVGLVARASLAAESKELQDEYII